MKCLAKLKFQVGAYEPGLLFNALIADNGTILLMVNGAYSLPVHATEVELLPGSA